MSIAIASLCNTTATVWQKTLTSDVYGTATAALTARYTSIPCRIQAISLSERSAYGAIRIDVTHKMYCSADYGGIGHSDEVTDAAGTRYRVTTVRDPDQMGHHTEVVMTELKGDIQ